MGCYQTCNIDHANVICKGALGRGDFPEHDVYSSRCRLISHTMTSVTIRQLAQHLQYLHAACVLMPMTCKLLSYLNTHASSSANPNCRGMHSIHDLPVFLKTFLSRICTCLYCLTTAYTAPLPTSSYIDDGHEPCAVYPYQP